MKRLALAVLFVLAALAAGCVSDGTAPQELTQEAACLQHFENDPVERARCRVPAQSRSDSVPDASPHQLPIRTGQPSD